jgi:DNA-binding CsgD family transcriptional regulator
VRVGSAGAGAPNRAVPGAFGSVVPELVLASIARELAGLADDEALLLRAAAVVGEPFDPGVAAAVAEVSAERGLALLDALLEADLVRPTDAPRRFRFRHPIVRQAIYTAAPAGWRLGAHARAAEALAARHTPALTRAHHVELSALPGDEAAIAILAEAGHAAAPRAPQAASHWFEAALALLAPDAVERRLGLLLPRARALAACGRFEESARALETVLDLIPPSDAALRARVIGSTAKIRRLQGEDTASRTALLKALEALDDRSSPEATALKLELAADGFLSSDWKSFDVWMAEALDDAHKRGDDSTIAAATGLTAAARYMGGDAEDSRRILGEALELIAALPDEALAEHLNSHTWTALGAVSLERYDESIELLERTIRVAQAVGQGHLPALMRTTLGLALACRGRLAEAEERLGLAIDASFVTDNPIFLTWALALQSWVVLTRGDLPRAVVLAGQAARAVPQADDPVSATAAYYLAEALLASGEPARAAAEMVERAGGEELPRIERGFRARCYEMLTRCALAQNDLDAARSWSERAAKAAAGMEIRGRDADAARAGTAVALAAEQPEDAARLAGEAAAIADACGLPVDAGRARVLRGRALAAQGDRDAAVAALRAAHASLAELDAGHHRDEAARELRLLGERTARKPAGSSDAGGPVGVLSPREREIAELVAAGQRNQEIAAALFLSVRTVEGHLARIFRKLEVSSRVQLAALVRGDEG